MELTQKGEMVSRLQAKAGQIGKILNNLEKYNHLLRDEKKNERKSASIRRSESRESAIVKTDGAEGRAPSSGGSSESKRTLDRAAIEKGLRRQDGNSDEGQGAAGE